MRREVRIVRPVGQKIAYIRQESSTPNSYRIMSTDMIPTEKSHFFVIQYNNQGKVSNVVMMSEEGITDFNLTDQMELFPVPPGTSISYSWVQA